MKDAIWEEYMMISKEYVYLFRHFKVERGVGQGEPSF